MVRLGRVQAARRNPGSWTVLLLCGLAPLACSSGSTARSARAPWMRRSTAHGTNQSRMQLTKATTHPPSLRTCSLQGSRFQSKPLLAAMAAIGCWSNVWATATGPVKSGCYRTRVCRVSGSCPTSRIPRARNARRRLGQPSRSLGRRVVVAAMSQQLNVRSNVVVTMNRPKGQEIAQDVNPRRDERPSMLGKPAATLAELTGSC
jgi:hypothetical protein